MKTLHLSICCLNLSWFHCKAKLQFFISTTFSLNYWNAGFISFLKWRRQLCDSYCIFACFLVPRKAEGISGLLPMSQDFINTHTIYTEVLVFLSWSIATRNHLKNVEGVISSGAKTLACAGLQIVLWTFKWFLRWGMDFCCCCWESGFPSNQHPQKTPSLSES